jgi:hypothetical protein
MLSGEKLDTRAMDAVVTCNRAKRRRRERDMMRVEEGARKE